MSVNNSNNTVATKSLSNPNHQYYTPTLNLTETIIRCPFSKCHTRLIKPQSNETHTLEIPNFQFLQAEHKEEDDDEQIKDPTFMKIADVWDFDNIGVSKEYPDNLCSSDGRMKVERLIICSDCERGPLGFACFENESRDVKDLVYYLNLHSVLMEVKEQ